ncbi:MAG: site-2 protease family protein [Desulfobacteraceae bacterium]
MFGKRFRLFNLLGFEVRVDLSWVVIAVLIAWSLSTGLFPLQYKGLSHQTYWVMGIIGAAGLFFSIIVHEFAHSVVARRHGMPMKGITLFIFGGVAEMGEEPPSPKSEFLMAIAGPISSFAIAVFFYLIQAAGKTAGLSQAVNGVMGYLALINGLLGAFNLIPAFPLDGGRALRAAIWHAKKDLGRATLISSRIGAGFGIGLILLGVLNVLGGNFVGGMWWFLLGMFLHGAARSSYQRLVTKGALEGMPVSRIMKRDPVTVDPSITVQYLVEELIYQYHHKMYPVMGPDGRLRGCVTTKDVKKVPREEWPQHTVQEIASECSEDNTVPFDADAAEALNRMQRSGNSRLMVTRDQRLEGVIALKDLMELVALKGELEGDGRSIHPRL